MAIGEQLTSAYPDGASMGQSDNDKISFYGVTPVVRATVAVAGSDAGTVQTLVNDLRTKLIALGLVK